ncbi:MAG TPA: thymidine kinase [Firmicutes bacterium]|jgi:thymidine kinase|nr:thymidine kinase [Bacillota bacterium]
MAKLYFRYSAMNAGKTTQLLQVKYNYEERGQNVLLIKPSTDERDGNESIKSRIGLESQAVVIAYDTDLRALVGDFNKIQSIHCVIIDEAQFLARAQVMQLCRIVDDANIPVIAYGLRSDFKGNLFPGSEALLAFSDSIEELKTICWCGKKAIMNTRLLDGKPVYEGEQILIGGNESYISLCRKHWYEGKVGPC